MPTVELLYFPDCPNVSGAREQLRRAFEAVGTSPMWTEVDVTAEGAPDQARRYGSPTILVDGKDVAGATPGAGSSCRIYIGSDERGVPPLDIIVSALRATPSPRPEGRAASFAVLPGALLSVLPLVSCPSCWPAYAGLLGSLGVPFLMDASSMLPLTVGALLLALVSLGYRAHRRRDFGPLLLGAVAAGGILLGKFEFELNSVVYTGIALLVAASAWNSWPKKHEPQCDACDIIRVQ